MNNQLDDKFLNKSALNLAGGASLLVTSLALTSPVLAQTTPVDQLETETEKLNDVYDSIVPVAVGAAVFAIGMILIKRIAFS
jgi:hypothetical protein